jgi:cytochrome c oxidase subunit 3
MASQTKLPALEESRRGEGGGGHGGSDGGESRAPSGRGNDASLQMGQTGIWIAMASIAMFFAAFTSAMVVRAGLGADWTPVAVPHILYLNTAILLVSSLTLELSQRALKAGRIGQFSGWLFTTTGLGIAFLAGQLDAWRELRERGVYLASNPASSFFYLLTAAHGIHLLGGLIALLYLVARHRRIAQGVRGRNHLKVAAIYWHFMDVLWVYLLLVLTVGSGRL